MESILKGLNNEEKFITWDALGYEAEVNTCEKSISGRMKQEHSHRKYIDCKHHQISDEERARRIEFAKRILAKYSNLEDWIRFRFSDEVLFGLGLQGRIMIIQKLGERYYPKCIIEEREPDKKLHAWAAVGYDFKSELVFYEIPSKRDSPGTRATLD
jgi:hypothetical protein